MHPLIENNLDAIRALCRGYGVEKLEVFGSIMTDDFRDDSDVDFIAHYPKGYDFGPWGSRFLELEKQLGEVLERDVDVLTASVLTRKNVYFQREVNASRKVIFDVSHAAVTA